MRKLQRWTKTEVGNIQISHFCRRLPFVSNLVLFKVRKVFSMHGQFFSLNHFLVDHLGVGGGKGHLLKYA